MLRPKMQTIKIGYRRLGKKGDGYCMMIPAIWLKNVEAHAGDRMEIEMYGTALVIKPGEKRK